MPLLEGVIPGLIGVSVVIPTLRKLMPESSMDNPMSISAAKAVAKQSNWLASQPPLLVDEFLDLAILKPLAAEQTLFRMGDPRGGLYGVIQGAMRFEYATSGSGSHILGCFQRGIWFGQALELSEAPQRRTTFNAVGETLLLEVPLSKLQAFRKSSADAATMIGNSALLILQYAERTVLDLLIPKANKRAASALLRVSNYPVGLPPESGWFIPLNQSALAQVANCSRDVMNRSIGEFQKRGWLEKQGRAIRLIDPEALSAFAYSE